MATLNSVSAPVSPRSIRVLVVEDNELDARILIGLLRQGGYQPEWKRVASGEAMRLALKEGVWDAILCDHSMPGFSAPEALRLLQETGLDIPFLIVSAGIGEDVAVAAMKAGANDFLIKGNLARLVPAVEREVREAEIRAARRHAEASLRESELRHRLVWENSADAVMLLDAGGYVRFANPAVETILGWAPLEVVGARLDRFQWDASAEWWWEARARDGGRLSDAVGRRRDGTPLDLDIAIREMRLHGEQLFAVFIRDITERKRTEAELRRSREEFAAAREIQQRLFPRASPAVPGLEVAGVSHPAEAAGGDYFDFPPMGGGRVGFLVADVSGHGIGPALLMAEARTCIRLLARQQLQPAELLSQANAALAEDLGSQRYITVLLAAWDPVGRSLAFASAGHPAGLVLAADGALKAELRRTGPPLGQRASYAYAPGAEVRLVGGDVLVLVTDGILESSRGAEAFGRDQLILLVQRLRHRPAREIVERICEEVRAFSAPEPQADDLTVVIVKVTDT